MLSIESQDGNWALFNVHTNKIVSGDLSSEEIFEILGRKKDDKSKKLSDCFDPFFKEKKWPKNSSKKKQQTQ